MQTPKSPFVRRPAPEITVRIESVAFGGDGIARHEGKVIFVPDSVPSEELSVTLEQEKERFARGRIVKRLSPAPYLSPSPCPYSSRCGGCQWLGVPAEQQAEWKRDFITSAFERIAKIKDYPPFTVTPSPAQGSYRNRIKIKLRTGSTGRVQPLYNMKGSHDLIAIDRCWIASAAINRALASITQLSFQGPERTFEIELQELVDEKVSVHFHEPVPTGLRQALRDSGLIEGRTDPQAFERDTRSGITYLTYSGQFQQVNPEANRLVRRWVEDKLSALQVATVLDLFCGSGNLSLGLLKRGMKVWGLEVSAPAIACAQANLKENNLSGGVYLRGSADQLEEKFPGLRPEAIIVDPPRAGMAEALPPLLALNAPHFIYLSCDPNTLARDLKALLGAGYKLESIEAFDFFPQTYHVETLVYLSKT